MKKLGALLVAGMLSIASIGVNAQSAARVRGTVSAFDGKVLSVKTREGTITEMQIGEKTEIVYTQPIALSDIKPGDFLGVTSSRRADGSLTAFEVRRFPKPVNPGHRPFDGRDDQTMTNATVAAVVEAAKGRELTLTYNGNAEKIIVPQDASISMLIPGNPSQLVPGAPVNLTAIPGADGRLTAQRIQVSKPR